MPSLMEQAFKTTQYFSDKGLVILTASLVTADNQKPEYQEVRNRFADFLEGVQKEGKVGCEDITMILIEVLVLLMIKTEKRMEELTNEKAKRN